MRCGCDRQKLYKKLGREVGDALRNRDEYIRAKERLEKMIADIEDQIREGLGRDVSWPTWHLRELVREIKKKAEAINQ